MNIISKKHLFFIFSILLTAFYFTYDLDNLDGLRQGTEGFYLQVSKEMEAKSSVMTPYYRGERHWSKPPLHFLFPLPLSKTGYFTHIHSARLSIAFLTIFLLVIASYWVKRHFQIESHATFIFLACTVGMFKYARIFMMEIPLSLLTFVSILLFYDYLKFKKLYYMLLAIFFGACAILIKGPVSIIITGASFFIYMVYRFIAHKKNLFKPIIIYGSATVLLGSLWFIASYISYGDEFFNYFFLRENVGKFTAKSYPVRHVIQGLLIFTLPWSLFLPYSYLSFKDFFTSQGKHETKNTLIFIIINAFTFLVVWLIPSQRSHHYAMPAVPFFLILILVTLVKPYSSQSESDKRINIYKTGNILLFIASLLVFTLLAVICYYVDIILPNKDFFYPMALYLTILFGSAVAFYKSRSVALKGLSAQTFIGIVWVLLSPHFIPSFIPQKVQDIIGEKSVIAHVRKPYFVEEAIDRKIELLHPSKMAETSRPQAVYILKLEDFINYKLKGKSTVLHKWSIWRRRTTLKQITNALKTRDISSIRQVYVIFKKP